MFRYDNSRDRYAAGYDAGLIVDGEVVLDVNTGEYVLLDEDGNAFSSQTVLKELLGKKVRMSCATYETIETVTEMLKQVQQV